MATGYTRNDTLNNIANGNIINADDFDGEFDAIQDAFESVEGHNHDGTTGGGAPIAVIGPTQDIVATATVLRPKADNLVDLGTSTLEFKDLYLDGTAQVDTLQVDESATITANLTVNGNTTLGNADTDTLTLTAQVATSVVPSADNAVDLGSSTKEWRDLYVDGTANIDSLVADTADINGGTIDGATITTSDITVGSGKTLNVSAGTLTLADNQISGDKVEGGTINAVTINTLNSTTIDTTNIEVTNLKAKDGTAAATIADTTGVVTIPSSVLTSTTISGGSISGITDLAVADGGTGASDAATARTNLGLGTISTQAASSVAITGGSITGITDLAVADGGTGASDAAGARTNLGLAIGTNVQAYDAGLQSIAGLTTTADRMIYTTASDVYAVTPLTTAGRALLDDADAAAQRTTLGLGTISTQAADNVSITGGSITGITDLTIADGGTGASDAAGARTNLGLGTAATTDSTAYATAAQGSTADSALQPGDAVPQTGATGSAEIPSGTEAQRDVAPDAGYFRFNTDVAKFEGYNGTAWGSVGGGATGGGADEIFIQNGQTVTTDYTIPADKNAMSTGPITINSGVTITVSTGARYVVI